MWVQIRFEIERQNKTHRKLQHSSYRRAMRYDNTTSIWAWVCSKVKAFFFYYLLENSVDHTEKLVQSIALKMRHGDLANELSSGLWLHACFFLVFRSVCFWVHFFFQYISMLLLFFGLSLPWVHMRTHTTVIVLHGKKKRNAQVYFKSSSLS